MDQITHPRLRAELLPSSTGVRLWLDDQRWADLATPPDELVVALRRADGWWPRTEERWDPLWTTLAHHGLADQGPSDRVLGGLRIAVLGSGSLARAVSVALGRGGADPMLVIDPRPPSQLEWIHSTEPTCGHAMARWLLQRRKIACRAGSGMDDLRGWADLVVVATQYVEPDRLVVDQLVRHGLAHLVLRAHRDLGRVGPMVEPGRTPCLGCHDLVVGARDTGRGATVARLGMHRSDPDETVVRAVAAQAVLEVGWWAQGHRGRLEGRVLGLDRLAPDLPVARFPVHPDCTCPG
ncbi:hypothetical protein [Luteococcus sanguinis]|uniref:THIF-type NAD/FAD binding fold domain-containing protein n=1 Tax=Luteococcus sanguinis TaxID=174038 RepID=A0ABW1X6K2_9ACTN